MKQVILLKGGEAKENYKDYYDFLEKQEYNPYEEKNVKWSDTLQEKLNNIKVITFQRPNSGFADYKARNIMFEKLLPYMKEDDVLLGHSLGGTFLVKYLNEDNPKLLEKIGKLILVAPAFKDSKNEVLGTFNFEDKKLENLKKYQSKITIFASKDDFIVPFEDIQDFMKILPDVNYKIFENKGHFLQEDFHELLQEI